MGLGGLVKYQASIAPLLLHNSPSLQTNTSLFLHIYLMDSRTVFQNPKQTAKMKRSQSNNSEFHSPMRELGDLPESPPYSSPVASLAVDKFTQFTPLPSPSLFNGAMTGSKVGEETRSRGLPRRSNRAKKAALMFRLSEVVLCLVSFSVMAADRTQGWSGDSFDRYKEYRYCLSVNVIGFAYSVLQACDLFYHLATMKYLMGHHLRFVFFLDQVVAYLLISASSSAATRVDDWQSNWGQDEFTLMATASVGVSFLAFAAFAMSSLISGYDLCTHDLP